MAAGSIAATVEQARAFLDRADFIWHQRFELVPGVETPGDHPIDYLFDLGGVPKQLDGKRVLDIGTTNGGAAFLMERWGAARVVAIDIYPPNRFGFDRLSRFLGSSAEYLQGTVYDLKRLVGGETFDYVLFWGVLYHLRHPLLALDEVRSVLAPDGIVDVETAVCDDELATPAELPVARFYRGGELAADPQQLVRPDRGLSRGLVRILGAATRAKRGLGRRSREAVPARAHRDPDEPEFGGSPTKCRSGPSRPSARGRSLSGRRRTRRGRRR